jgi:hypothetical protein
MSKEKKYTTEIQPITLKSAGRPKINNAKVVKALIPIERICEFKEVVKSFQKLRVIDEGNFQKFKPIPLTEEWLINFGFKKRNDRLFTLNYFEIHIVNGGFYFKSSKLIPLNFIHQLQNTYFISEGIELELSSNIA